MHMKKTAAGLVEVVLVFSSCVLNAQTLEFDGDTTGEPPSGWVEQYNNSPGSVIYTREEAAALGVTVSVNEDVFFGANGKSVHFNDANSAVASTLSYRLAKPTTSVMLEYYMRSADSSKEGAFVKLDGDGSRNFGVVFSNGVAGGRAGFIGINANPGGWIKADLLPYRKDIWYRVRLTVDCLSQVITFDVCDVGNPSNSASYSITDSSFDQNFIDLVLMFSSGSQGADAFIDKIRIIDLTNKTPPQAD